MSVDEARDKIDQKAQLAAEKAAAKAARALKKQERATAQALHQAGIKARKAERERKKRVAALTKARAQILEELQDLILDLEAIDSSSESESTDEEEEVEYI